MLRRYYVYIMANNRPTLYIGVTNRIERRSTEHKHHLIHGYTYKYNVTKLVYFEQYYDINEAIKREKQIKHWNRSWKMKLIQKVNPRFEDLYDKLFLGKKFLKADPRSSRG